jgi:hypothetical protein
MSHRSSWSLTWINVKIKVTIIIVLKPDLVIDLGQELGNRSWPSTRVDRINLDQCKNKNSYYHNFKILLEGRPEARLESLVKRVNPGQCKDKSGYYHSFKTWLGVNSGQGLSHRSRWSTRVNNKNDYYHNFKT